MNYRFRRQSPIEEEKLALTKLVAQALKPRNVLDAFAGDGTSTRIYCKSAHHVLAIEKGPSAAACILKSSRPWKRAVVWGDNLTLLPFLAAESVDLVDLDPYGTCYPQLEYAGRLVSRHGAIMVKQKTVAAVSIFRIYGLVATSLLLSSRANQPTSSIAASMFLSRRSLLAETSALVPSPWTWLGYFCEKSMSS